MRRTKRRMQKPLLFLLLAVTRAFNRLDIPLPLRWYSLIDSIQVSSGILHDRIGMIDEEVEQEFRRVEKQFDRRIGNEKFYSEDEIQELRSKINEIQI